MRYYEYISDSKVDMLLPQIPDAMAKDIESEIGFDLKVLKGSIKEHRVKLQDRVSRVSAVEHYLKSELIGRNKVSPVWMHGTMRGCPIQFKEAPEAVFFWGIFQNKPLLLGGSANHLLGGRHIESCDSGISFAPRLITAFLSSTQSEERGILFGHDPEIKIRASVGSDDNPYKAWEVVVKQLNSQKNILQETPLDFMARRLISQDDKCPFSLATPLFVATPM